MATQFLPFKVKAEEHSHNSNQDIFNCPLYRMLPQNLQLECRNHKHILHYLHALPIEKFGIPDYYEKLSRAMRDMKSPNLLYPVGESVFIHIYPDTADVRNYYIAVEPSILQDLEGLLHELELRLVEFVEELQKMSDAAERHQILLKLLDMLVVVRNGNGGSHNGGRRDSGILSRLMKGRRNGNSRLTLTPSQYEGLRYLLKRNIAGLGILQPMIQDPYIEDISCSGLGPIFVEHKIFGSLKSNSGFSTHEELDLFVTQLAEKIGRPVTFRDPTVDASLPDGSRINIVFGSDVSKRGSNFTIRKFSTTPTSILELIDFGTLNYQMAAYISLCIQEGMSLFVSGETASGKTTLLNAITTFIPPDAKIVSIEDTPEIQVPHPNWIRGVTRGGSKNEGESSITLFDLLKAALRQRPNQIIIGEIRGVEGAVAFQAMQTGHACMSTFHASSVTKLVQRLTGKPIEVPKAYIDNLNLVLIMSMVRLPNGKTARRCLSINEIIGYDSATDSFSFVEAFRWNPLDDTFEFRGYMNSYLMEEKIAPRRGIPYTKKRTIYQLIEQRANILERIHERKVTNFYALYNTLTKAYREGYFR